ncbi:sulfotransferase [Paraneptunicella aestuarii]|uniref:tetratricopeptide repeat-containing sulfotransferase family protein n=1 Tax=Paraneptunicella aestuarii TaxID=2831148 RepID=UPI001E443B2B|nr:sulfotransferase [Paraneptunicella aestuarii]UAA37773.1 sulfotransferase [Paraneptunicella aestuarii]
MSEKVEQQLASARLDMQLGNFSAGVEKLSEILQYTPNHHQALQMMVNAQSQQRNYQGLIDTLKSMIHYFPTEQGTYFYLADVYQYLNQLPSAISVYQSLLKAFPDNATAHFNLAMLLGKIEAFSEALTHYQICLDLNISQPEEVFLNRSVLFYRQGKHESAIVELKQALDIAPEYQDAHFNLATIYEELGDKDRALEIYFKLAETNPAYEQVFERLANASAFNNINHPLIETVSRLLSEGKLSEPQRESICFGLGKLYDEHKQYDAAFQYYQQGNVLSERRVGEYEPDKMKKRISDLIDIFSPELFSSITLDEADSSHVKSPVFVCGMFRSGTTLIEQVLSKHESFTSGGELEFINNAVRKVFPNYPSDLGGIEDVGEKLRGIRESYLAFLTERFGDKATHTHIIDKRPDNFMHIGLIKLIFPNARIIHTLRHPLDNMISVYFQHLGNDLPYANNLEHIAHYYGQHYRLLQHWRSVFGEQIFCLSYEDFVANQADTTRRLLDYCVVDWDEQCLQFHQSSNAVSTASIWQVRKPLYESAVKRWLNYENHLTQAKKILAAQGLNSD